MDIDNTVLEELSEVEQLDNKFTELIDKLEYKINTIETQGNKKFTKIFKHLELEPFSNINNNSNCDNQNCLIIKSILISILVFLVNHKFFTNTLNKFTNEYISINLLQIIVLFFGIYLTLSLL